MKLIKLLFKLIFFFVTVAGMSVPLASFALQYGGAYDFIPEIIRTNVLYQLIAAAGAAFIIMLLVRIFTRKSKVANFFVTLIIYAGLAAAAFFFPYDQPLLAYFGFEMFTNDILLFVAAGVVFVGTVMSMLLGKRKPKNVEIKPLPKEAPTSRGSDSELIKQKAKGPVERFVRDPWGNLIPEREYNQRINDAKRK